jgi:metal-responsive CopG/Arc/MetJ family transcriptional regulator
MNKTEAAKKGAINLYLPAGTQAALKTQAKRENTTRSEVVSKAVMEYITAQRIHRLSKESKTS